jgi:uncharacterized protein YndB with AHSA1/START domain
MNQSPLQVEAEGTARARPEMVWSLVADANQYPKWGPWRAGGYRQAGDSSVGSVTGARVGAIQWLESEQRAYLRRATSVEKILEVEEGSRIVYTVVRGIPVKNYRAEVTLTAVADGSAPATHIRWAATWDNTLTGRVVHRKLLTVYPDIVARLIAAAEKVEASSP